MPKGNRGGRRAASGKSYDEMHVPYDEWGEPVSYDQIYGEIDGERAMIGWYEDRQVYDYVEDIRPVTKKDVLDDINAWRNDDGTYGDDDVTVMVAYKDGSVVSDDELNGKAFKKSGIVGASISTADYEMVWGGEIGRDGNLHQWKTHDSNGDERGPGNSYAGYKAVSVYWIRNKVMTTNRRANGTFYTTYERVRQSTKKPLSR